MLKILVVGAGAVGGYFGVKLAASGADVTFLLRPKRFDYVQKNGLQIESSLGNLHIFPKIVTAENLSNPYDLIILTAKAYDLVDAVSSLKNISSAGYILPFLNGIQHFDYLDATFGIQRVLGGTAQIASTLTAEGIIKHLNPLQTLVIGSRHPSQDDICQQFYQLSQSANFNCVLSSNIQMSLWEKWVFLATLAAVTCLFRTSIGKILESTYGKELILLTFSEAYAISEENGYTISEATKQRALDFLTQPDSSMTASMLRDLQAGNKNESKHILQELITLAKKTDCILLKTAYTHIQATQN